MLMGSIEAAVPVLKCIEKSQNLDFDLDYMCQDLSSMKSLTLVTSTYKERRMHFRKC